jgi:molybdenum ABC transporter molybdate-binding protein
VIAVSRTASPPVLAVSSLVVLAAIVAALWWREQSYGAGSSDRPLIVYAAPTVRLALERIAADYEVETGRRVELRFGPSEDILTKVRYPSPVEPADLFIPADDSYIRHARELGLVADSLLLARIRGVLLLKTGNPKGIAAWPDLLRDDVKVALGNPGAAIGKLTREHLVRTGRWNELKPHVIDTGTVTEAANAAKAGSVDAAIVWDVVAHAPAYSDQTILILPELDGVAGRIEIAVLMQSSEPTGARRLARYIAASDRGLVHFRALRFRVEEQAEAWESKP